MQNVTATAAESTRSPRLFNTRTRVLSLIREARSDFPGAAKFLGAERLESLAEAIIRSAGA